MFGKAKVKRYYDELPCVPAPNAYDAKNPQSGAGVVSINSKSTRFQDPKYVTPGPGEYLVPSAIPVAVKQSIYKLSRSNSFRLKKGSTGSIIRGSSSSDMFRTPSSSSTPRKLRRSTSSSDITLSPSKHFEEIEMYKTQIRDLEDKIVQLTNQPKDNVVQLTIQSQDIDIQLTRQLEDIDVHLNSQALENQQEKTNNEMVQRDELEILEAELSTCKSELKYQSQLVDQLYEEKEQLIKKCDCIREKEDRIDSLVGEVELLNEDNFNLETEIQVLKDEREQSENELERLNQVKQDLETKYAEEDAKNGFLYFTQEQLNLQIESLQHVVNSLRQENHLLSRGINKMVRAVQQEKMAANAVQERLREVTDTYTKENADSEQEFKKLHHEIIQMRETIGLLSDENDNLKDNLAEATKEVEVHENDKSALNQALKALETEKNGLAMDLGVLVKNKVAAKDQLQESNEKNAQLERELEEVRSEIHELEMSKLGLEGTLASIREELGQAEATLQGRDQQVMEKESGIQLLRDRETKLEHLLNENKDIISKYEELTTVLKDNESNLKDKLDTKQTQIDELTGLVREGCEDNARMIQKASQLRNDLTNVSQLLSQSQLEAEKTKEQLQEMESLVESKEERIKELHKDLASNHSKIDSLEIQLKTTLETMGTETEAKLKVEEVLSNKENEVVELTNRITELKLNREEIEESLLDTQELVECMEAKLQDAYTEYKHETYKLTSDINNVTNNLDDVKLERTKLIDINTDLSNQVSESLHAIANLQERERFLEGRCKEYELQLEIESEEMEQGRNVTSQLEQEVTNLQGELETCLAEMGSMEVERIELKETLNVVLEQLEDTKDHFRKQTSEFKQSKSVGRELLSRVQELETQATTLEGEANKWKQRTCDREQEVTIVQQDLTLLQDKVRHLEQVRDNLEVSLIEKGDQVEEHKEKERELRNDMEKVVKEKEIELAKQEELTKVNHRLKGNLEQHQEELRTIRAKNSDLHQQLEASNVRGDGLKAEISSVKAEAVRLSSEVTQLTKSVKVKTDVLETKNLLLQEKEERIQSLESDTKQREQLRMKEMDVLINLRSELESREAVISELKNNTSAVDDLIKSQEVDKAALAQANLRIDELESALDLWKNKLSEADSVMKLMEDKLEEEEARNRGLEEMIEPFRDQLQSFELEKNSLLSENTQAQEEVKKLANQYGQLLGHQNQKQKIQHVVKIKQENVELKTEITNLRKQVAKQKQSISKLEDKLNESMGVKRFDPRLSFATPSKNKENMTPIKGTPLSRMTPMGPPKLGYRGRSNSSVTLSSPLRDKNY